MARVHVWQSGELSGPLATYAGGLPMPFASGWFFCAKWRLLGS